MRLLQDFGDEFFNFFNYSLLSEIDGHLLYKHNESRIKLNFVFANYCLVGYSGAVDFGERDSIVHILERFELRLELNAGLAPIGVDVDEYKVVFFECFKEVVTVEEEDAILGVIGEGGGEDK